MFNRKIFVLSVFSLLFCAAGAEESALVWDFSREKPCSRSDFLFRTRNKTVVKEGALYSPDVLRTNPGGYIADKIYPELTPPGAFRFTAEFSLDEPRSTQNFLMLWDNKCDFFIKKGGKAIDNSGFTIGLSRTKDGKKFVPHAWLGFGTATSHVGGNAVPFEKGARYTLEFDYNGSGEAKFFVNGRRNAVRDVLPGGALAPAKYRTVIGDRVLGHFFRFDGRIYRISLLPRAAEKILIVPQGRRTFLRNEEGAKMEILVRNVSRETVSGLEPGQSRILHISVPVSLSPGNYKVPVEFGGVRREVEYRVGPVEHDRMTVVMWGYGDSYRYLQESGFTHGLNSIAAKVLFYPDDKKRPAAIFQELDDMLASGFRRMDYFNICHFPAVVKRFPRISRKGKPIVTNRKMNIDANDPEAIRFLTEIAEKTAKRYGTHPALTMLDLNSEIRDRTAPSFSKHETGAFRRFAGYDVPDRVEKKTILYSTIDGFPAGRIIKEDYPYYVYYRWFWSDGDGWNPMHTRISEAYHRHIRHPFFTYFAPAARQPAIQAVGGKADMLGQWTYVNPDPLRLAAAADELLAVANGRPVLQGTQLICYRSQCAPKNVKVDPVPEWVRKNPDASYITTPPDAVVEAVWASISRGVSGLIFHGDGSFYPPPIKGASIYKYTNPETEPAFRKVMQTVVHPLGPTLKRIPDGECKVAILHSFTSAVLAERGSYGWGGWLMDLHLALQWGGLDPRVICEEDILRGKLSQVKVLVLAHCDVLTERIFREIVAFQLRGGIVVADGTTPPAILPQVRIAQVSRAGKDPLAAKAALVALGQELHRKLAPHFVPEVSSSSPDLVARMRGSYLFVINDRRTYGDYFGPWKRMAEKALPVKGSVRVRRQAGAVYDVIAGKKVPFAVKERETEIPVDISGAGGKLFLLLPKDFSSPKVEISPDGLITADAGCDETVPVRLEVRDGRKRLTDDTHYAAAPAGKFRYRLDLPANAFPGNWKITFRVLPSGKEVSVIWPVPDRAASGR